MTIARPTRVHARRLAALTMMALLSGCGYGQPDDATASRVDGGSVIQEIAPDQREELPRFSGETLDGSQFDSRDYAGKVLVVNVWGSWCAPCRAEAPGLRKVSDEFRNRGVAFVGVDVRDNNAAAIAFERHYRITYPSISTASSADAMLAVGSVLPRSAVPSTLVLDRQGKVAARVVGATTEVTLRDLVTAVVHEGS